MTRAPTIRRFGTCRRASQVAALTLALLAVPSFAPPLLSAQEAEEILEYDVVIEVGDGGVMRVRESIRVRALGDRIRRGIYRDIPTSFPRTLGLGRIEAPFEVISVTRNGQPERYVVETVGGPVGRRGMRIRIGNPSVTISEGVHEYAIEYETSRWIAFGDGTDELYWNVTGNDWAFPIQSATARVSLPGVRQPRDLQVWTGVEGSTAQDAEVRWDESTSTAVFETTDPLAPGEGITVGVGFPSGFIAPPDEEQRAQWTRMDWGGWIDAGYVVLFVVALYLLMWRRVGMDPPPGRVGFQDEPPAGYSPSALGYIDQRGYDQNQLSAALVNMALKGALRIESDGDGWTLQKRATTEEAAASLSPEEAALFRELLGARDSISLTRTNHTKLRSAIKAFRSSLSSRLEREYFETNRTWFAVGLAVSVLGFAALAWRWRFDINPVALFLGVWLTIWSAGVGTMAYRIVHGIRTARRSGDRRKWAQVAPIFLFSIPFFIAEIVVAGILFFMVPVHLLVAGIVLGATNILFYHLLERPTLKGQGVLDGLKAFRAHLESAADWASRQGTTTEAVRGFQTFERLFPFAIALKMEERWATAFDEVLTAAVAPGMDPGRFDWYQADHAGGFKPRDLARDLGSGIGGRFSAMSSPPSTSSSSGSSGGFSSGGGSSGGGGGGGGGGGW